MQDLFARGGFLSGTSAGAHILGSVCYQDADSHAVLAHPVPTNADLTASGVVCGEEGALYQGLPCDKSASGYSLVFDSHFGARGRLARLCAMQHAGGAAYAIGLDEATGIAISDGVGTVFGSGTVTVLDNRDAAYKGTDTHFAVSGLRVSLLSAGDQFNFSNGCMLPAASKSAGPPGSAETEQPEVSSPPTARRPALFSLSPAALILPPDIPFPQKEIPSP